MTGEDREIDYLFMSVGRLYVFDVCNELSMKDMWARAFNPK